MSKLKREYITHLIPDADFTLRSDTYNSLRWYDPRPRPTEQDIIEAGEEYEAQLHRNEKRHQIREELRWTPAPNSNPQLAERIRKLEFILGIQDDYEEIS